LTDDDGTDAAAASVSEVQCHKSVSFQNKTKSGFRSSMPQKAFRSRTKQRVVKGGGEGAENATEGNVTRERKRNQPDVAIMAKLSRLRILPKTRAMS
jgi:hypothetical protein